VASGRSTIEISGMVLRLPLLALWWHTIRMLLYKYMPPERRQFLEKLLIRFTPPGLFNDPFDCLPFIDGFDASTIRNMVDRPARKIAESLAQKQVSEAFRKRVLAALELSKASLFKCLLNWQESVIVSE
jgi:hypothetical protein